MTNFHRIGMCLIFALIISCSTRDEEPEAVLVLPKSLTSKSPQGDHTTYYNYIEGNKLKSTVRNGRVTSERFYTDNLITKSISYNDLGEITSQFTYEYANNRLSKSNIGTGILNYSIYFTWIDNDHVSIEDDSVKPAGTINKTEVYFSNGNIVKTTNYHHAPNYYTITEVNIIENDTKNNPFKNIEGHSLITFDTKGDFFSQANNITKITTTRRGTVNGEPFSEDYFRTFSYKYSDQMFPIDYTVNSSYGSSYIYEFAY